MRKRRGNAYTTVTLEIEVEVEGHASPGCKEQGPTYACGGTPAEPPEMEDIRVYLSRPVTVNGKQTVEHVEIGDYLSDKQLEEVEQQLWESLGDGIED